MPVAQREPGAKGGGGEGGGGEGGGEGGGAGCRVGGSSSERYAFEAGGDGAERERASKSAGADLK